MVLPDRLKPPIKALKSAEQQAGGVSSTIGIASNSNRESYHGTRLKHVHATSCLIFNGSVNL